MKQFDARIIRHDLGQNDPVDQLSGGKAFEVGGVSYLTGPQQQMPARGSSGLRCGVDILELGQTEAAGSNGEVPRNDGGASAGKSGSDGIGGIAKRCHRRLNSFARLG